MADTILIEIGNAITDARKSKTLTLEALSTNAHISYQALSLIEKGSSNFKVTTLLAIIKALGVSADSILGTVNYNWLAENFNCLPESKKRLITRIFEDIMAVTCQSEVTTDADSNLR